MIARILLPFAMALAACSEADDTASVQADTATLNAIADLAGAASCAAKGAGALPASITDTKASLEAHAATLGPDCASYAANWDMHAIRWRGLALTRPNNAHLQICADFKLGSDKVQPPSRFPELAEKRDPGRHCFSLAMRTTS